MRHMISLRDWSGKEIQEIIDLALKIKKAPKNYSDCLANKTLVMIFQKTSTRTRISFEAGMTQLGGHAIFLEWGKSNLPLTSTKYEIKYISRNSDFIMARVMKDEDLLKMEAGSEVPLINGCDDKFHPSQIVSDLMTIKEKRGKLEGAKLVYVGVHNNVANSLIEGCIKVGVQLTLVTPIVNEPSYDKAIIEEANKTGLLKQTLNLKEALSDADFVYLDTWVDMEYFNDPAFQAEKEKRIKLMMPYQLNRKALNGLNPMIMHDMPIHTGYEIEDELVESPNSIIFDQAENLLHTRKALLITLDKKRNVLKGKRELH
jgi:ornithine carbamoyltransferase